MVDFNVCCTEEKRLINYSSCLHRLSLLLIGVHSGSCLRLLYTTNIHCSRWVWSNINCLLCPLLNHINYMFRPALFTMLVSIMICQICALTEYLATYWSEIPFVQPCACYCDYLLLLQWFMDQQQCISLKSSFAKVLNASKCKDLIENQTFGNSVNAVVYSKLAENSVRCF